MQIVAAGRGYVSVPQALEIVKMPQELRQNDTLRRRVARKAKKLEMAARSNPSVLVGPPPLPVVQAPPGSGRSDESSLTVMTNSSGLSDIQRQLQESFATSPNNPGNHESTNSTSSKSQSTDTEKKRRHSSQSVQQNHAVIAKQRKLASQGMKLATVRIQQNSTLSPSNPKKKTHGTIVEEVNKAVGSNINVKTAGRMVKNGFVGVSPLKRGPAGSFPPNVWRALKNAFVSYVKLELATSKKQSTLRDLAKRVNALSNEGGMIKNGQDLARKLRKETADELEVGKKNMQEHRRIMWTTANNLSVWFDTWEATLIELGFARKKLHDDPASVEGSLFFFTPERIVNFDETDGTLDNTTGNRGGRPPIVFYSNDVVGGATVANKSAYSPTIICAVNALGEALPPHFQLKTQSKTDAGERFSIDFIANVKGVRGKFGFAEERLFDVTFGMNERAGMNAEELDKYIENSILPLYPDIEDVPGKRLLIKLDSGPGRTNVKMLAKLRLKGVYIHPGVPNTTHVTQELDQLYGQFKSVYRQNLELLSQERFEMKKGLAITDLPMIVFGRAPSDNSVALRDAFAEAFTPEKVMGSWKKCGAVPLTRAALSSPQVRHELSLNTDVEKTSEQVHLINLEATNHFSCDVLTSLGYGGSHLRTNAPREAKRKPLTEAHSKERVLLLQSAKTAGALFHATGGTHINSDDFFRSRAMKDRENEIKKLEALKKSIQTETKQSDAYIKIIREKGIPTRDNQKEFTKEELMALVRSKYGGKIPKDAKNKPALLEAYLNGPRVVHQIWYARQEKELLRLKEELVTLNETKLAVQAKQNARAVRNNIALLDEKDKQDLLLALTKKEDEEENGPNVI